MTENKRELSQLCSRVKELTGKNTLDECYEIISQAMAKYPHAPQPHNLIGVLLEKEGDHTTAMKHFRAAWALDPTYIPARFNMDRFASFYSTGKPAFDDDDCSGKDECNGFEIKYDEKGIGHVGRIH